MGTWVEVGQPTTFWISGFFFPQGFCTGQVQNFARRHRLPIDTITLGFRIMDETAEELHARPEDGCYVDGLFLEGARFDKRKHSLVDPKPKELFSKMPVMHL